MKHYLIRLSYTANAWNDIINNTPDKDALGDRLAPIVGLVRRYGGSLANYHFFEDPFFASSDKEHVVICKFVPFGDYDIVAIAAFPDDLAARSLSAVIAAEPGVKSIEMTPLIPLEEVLQAMPDASAARRAAPYSAPGRSAAAQP